MIRRSSPKRSTKPISRNSRPKAKRGKPRRVSALKCPEYVDWLHERQCVVCAKFPRIREIGMNMLPCLYGLIDGAHSENNGTGSKGPDNSRFPCCRYHHTEQHRIGVPAWEAKYGISREKEAAAHWKVFQLWKEGQTA